MKNSRDYPLNPVLGALSFELLGLTTHPQF